MKETLISRLNQLAEKDTKEVEAIMAEWEKYGKSRTYFKLRCNGKTHDFGYYDNVSDKYIPANENLAYDDEYNYDFGGNNRIYFDK